MKSLTMRYLILVEHPFKSASVRYCNPAEIHIIKSVVMISIGGVFVVIDVFIVIVVCAFDVDFVLVILVALLSLMLLMLLLKLVLALVLVDIW